MKKLLSMVLLLVFVLSLVGCKGQDVDNDITSGKITRNEGNLKILDLLLKYKMIDKETILDLYNNGKIREIKDIETVVLNY